MVTDVVSIGTAEIPTRKLNFQGSMLLNSMKYTLEMLFLNLKY